MTEENGMENKERKGIQNIIWILPSKFPPGIWMCQWARLPRRYIFTDRGDHVALHFSVN